MFYLYVTYIKFWICDWDTVYMVQQFDFLYYVLITKLKNKSTWKNWLIAWSFPSQSRNFIYIGISTAKSEVTTILTFAVRSGQFAFFTASNIPWNKANDFKGLIQRRNSLPFKSSSAWPKNSHDFFQVLVTSG